MRWRKQAPEQGPELAAGVQPEAVEPRRTPEEPRVLAQAPALRPVQPVQAARPPITRRARDPTCAAGEPTAASAAVTRWTRFWCRVKRRRCVYIGAIRLASAQTN